MTPEIAIRTLYMNLKECGFDGPFALRLPEKEVERMKTQIEATFKNAMVTNSHEFWPSEVAFECHGVRVGKLVNGRF